MWQIIALSQPCHYESYALHAHTLTFGEAVAPHYAFPRQQVEVAPNSLVRPPELVYLAVLSDKHDVRYCVTFGITPYPYLSDQIAVKNVERFIRPILSEDGRHYLLAVGVALELHPQTVNATTQLALKLFEFVIDLVHIEM